MGMPAFISAVSATHNRLEVNFLTFRTLLVGITAMNKRRPVRLAAMAARTHPQIKSRWRTMVGVLLMGILDGLPVGT